MSVTTSEITAREIYLQFWFPTSSIEPESGKVFSISQACTTTTPVPYGLASSSANAYTLRGSKFSGTYDSRIDSSITSPTIPVIISKVIAFNPPFTDTPEVVVWLTGLSATTGTVVSILVTATNITTTQFTLQIDSSAGDHLFSVSVAWAVWKADVKLGVDFRNTFQRSVSHSVWTLQHAAVSAVKLVLEPEQYMTLDATMVEYRDDTKIWHYRLMLGDWKEHSVTMVTVMRSS
ncbi:hypothetical protein Q9L58_006530 [Maublancomyces gigas]|uniref:H-type lectin domain-containing protein n=1 Tax=Discina gigas TaxID=1032678 RepID=A0ABR3GFI6_9PEZI